MKCARSEETILAHGHKNISASHETTIEITKETCLSHGGDCIVAVAANKAVRELSEELKKYLRRDNAKINITIEVGGLSDRIEAYGDSRLILAHPTDTVIRKSGYICSRTLAVHANKSASDMPRDLVREMRDSEQGVKITIVAES